MTTRIVSHSTLELTAALQQLKELTSALKSSQTKPVISQSILERLRHFFAANSTPVLPRELPTVVAKITQALPLILQLQKGTPEQQDLALRAIDVIGNYNAVIEQVAARHAYRDHQSQRPLPLKITSSAITCFKRKIAKSTESSLLYAKVDGAFRSQIPETSIWGVKEQDLFHMKAIVLLVRYGLSHSEAQAVVRERVVLWQEDSDCFIAVLAVTLLPGERVILTAGFTKRAAQGTGYELQYCQLFPLIAQTGFPDSCQYTGGWVLSHELIDVLMERMQSSDGWYSFLRDRKAIAVGLLPAGIYHERARQLINLKSHVFKKHAASLIPLHQQQADALFTALGVTDTQECINDLFTHLQTESNPLKALSEVYQLFNESYFGSAWQHTTLSQLQTAHHAIEDTLTERLALATTVWQTCSLRFVLLLGRALFPAVQHLLFSSPSSSERELTLAEIKLLMLVHAQQQSFIEQLSCDVDEESVYQRMCTDLQRDTAILMSDSDCVVPSHIPAVVG
jgi:hypothetical protein